MDKRQPPPRRRKLLLGKHPVARFVISPRPARASKFRQQPAFLRSLKSYWQISPFEDARSSGVTKPSSGSSLFNGNSGKQMRDDRSHALILYMFAAVAGLSFLAAVYLVAWAYR